MAASVEVAGILNPRDGWTADRCSIAAALDVVSARSAFLVLREAFYGTTRFRDFARRVGLTEAVVAGRLKELVDEGLLMREDYREEGQRTRQRYLLTEKGADLFPVLLSLMQWGDRWTTDDGGAVEFRHRGCGAHVRAQVMCDNGHEVSSGDLELWAKRKARRSKRTVRS